MTDDRCPVCGRTYAIHLHHDTPQQLDLGPDVTGTCTLAETENPDEYEVIIHVN